MRIATVLPPVLARFAGFVAVGAVGTAAHYSTLWALVELAGFAVLPATTVGFVVGAIVNYTLSRRFVFRSRSSHASALPKFLLVAGLGAGINGVVVAALLAVTDIHYLLVQLAATGAVLLWNFAANSLWTFRA